MYIRSYHPLDQDTVWELHNLGLNQTGTNLGNGHWDDDLHNAENIYLQNEGEFLVGHIDERLIAMGAFRKTSDTSAEIKRMRVHPEFQGKGYGQRVYESLESRAIEFGYRKLHLDTTAKQLPAQKLYKKVGFKEVNRKTIKGLELIFYEKILGNIQ